MRSIFAAGISTLMAVLLLKRYRGGAGQPLQVALVSQKDFT